MKLKDNRIYIRLSIYILIALFIVIRCLFLDSPNLFFAEKALKNINISELLTIIWQIQTVIISFSLIAISILQSSFHVRIYGQKIVRLESYHMFTRIVCSLSLILLMAFPVIKGYYILVFFIFIISLFEVSYLFWDILRIMKHPANREKQVKSHIKKQLKKFLENYNDPEIRKEFVSTVDYLISHTKELIKEENFIEVKANQDLLNHIMKRLFEERCYNFEEYKIIYQDYKDIKDKYKEAGRSDFENKINEILASNETNSDGIPPKKNFRLSLIGMLIIDK